jgi:WD40 repeat protein
MYLSIMDERDDDNSSFARAQDNQTAPKIYKAILGVQESVTRRMVNGRLYLKPRLGSSRVEYSSDGRHLCILESTNFTATLRDLLKSPTELLWSYDNVSDAKFGPNHLLITSQRSGEINLWSITEPVVSHTTLIGERTAGAYQIFTSDRFLLAVLKDEQPKMWEWTSPIKSVDARLLGPIVQACFSPNDQFVVVSDGVSVKLLTLQDGQLTSPKAMPRSKEEYVLSLQVSGDSTVIAAVCSFHVYLWWTENVETVAKELRFDTGRDWPPPCYQITHAVFSPDGAHIIVGLQCGDVILLTKTQDIFEKVLQFQVEFDLGHLTWSPDGRFVTLASDRSITIVDIAKMISEASKT